MAYRTRRYRPSRTMWSRRSVGRYRRRAGTRRGRSMRLVISAPRGIMARPYSAYQTRRYRRSRRF